jgi:hypothetical protein
MKSILARMILVPLLLVVLAACSSGYYMVTEPVTGKVYYTDDLKKEDGGGITLEDANTGSSVTLQNSEVKKISADEFRANTRKK